MFKRILPFLFIFLGVLLLYYPALLTYFSQDDFFHFKVSQTDGSLSGFFNLFAFLPFKERGIAFYRPVSREALFNIYYLVFGLNSIPFRIFSFIVHFLNIYLVFTLVQRFFNKKALSFFVAFFFSITAAHVATLYYLAGGIQTLLSTTFTLLSILFFHNYLDTSKLKFQLLALLTFILGITSEEQTLIVPILFTGLIIILKGVKNIKNYLGVLLPYFIIAMLLIFVEIFKIGFSSSEQQYQPIFNIKTTLNSLMWYSGWALGIPETLIDFVFPGFKLNPNLLKYWTNYYIFIFPAFFLSVVLLIIQFIYLFIQNRSFYKNKFFLFALLWCPLGLLPVILLPLHKSTHYLEISLPAFWIIIGFTALNAYQKMKNPLIAKACLTLFVASLTILSTASAILGGTNYWAASRGKIAQHLISEIKATYPILPKGSLIYFRNDPNYPFLTKEWGGSSKQASVILNGSDALELYYKDLTIKVFYEDLGGIPKNTIGTIYTITAKIP